MPSPLPLLASLLVVCLLLAARDTLLHLYRSPPAPRGEVVREEEPRFPLHKWPHGLTCSWRSKKFFYKISNKHSRVWL